MRFAFSSAPNLEAWLTQFPVEERTQRLVQLIRDEMARMRSQAEAIEPGLYLSLLTQAFWWVGKDPESAQELAAGLRTLPEEWLKKMIPPDMAGDLVEVCLRVFPTGAKRLMWEEETVPEASIPLLAWAITRTDDRGLTEALETALYDTTNRRRRQTQLDMLDRAGDARVSAWRKTFMTEPGMSFREQMLDGPTPTVGHLSVGNSRERDTSRPLVVDCRYHESSGLAQHRVGAFQVPAIAFIGGVSCEDILGSLRLLEHDGLVLAADAPVNPDVYALCQEHEMTEGQRGGVRLLPVGIDPVGVGQAILRYGFSAANLLSPREAARYYRPRGQALSETEPYRSGLTLEEYMENSTDEILESSARLAARRRMPSEAEGFLANDPLWLGHCNEDYGVFGTYRPKNIPEGMAVNCQLTSFATAQKALGYYRDSDTDQPRLVPIGPSQWSAPDIVAFYVEQLRHIAEKGGVPVIDGTRPSSQLTAVAEACREIPSVRFTASRKTADLLREMGLPDDRINGPRTDPSAMRRTGHAQGVHTLDTQRTGRTRPARR